MGKLEKFLQQVEALAEAASDTAEQLRDGGMGYLAERLEKALADLAAAPPPRARRSK